MLKKIISLPIHISALSIYVSLAYYIGIEFNYITTRGVIYALIMGSLKFHNTLYILLTALCQYKLK